MTTSMTDRETRLSQLKAALDALKAGPPADVIGRLLRAGALARRSHAVGLSRGEVKALLSGITPVELTTALEPTRLRGVRAALLQAAEEAVEAALAEDDEERRIWRHSAWEALSGRDGLESLKTAAELCDGSEGDGAEAVVQWKQQLAEVDRTLLPKWRWFVALNDQRRVERGLLDDDQRPASPWFSARMECDGLIAALAGEALSPVHTAHVAGCADCQRDLRRTASVGDGGPRWHVGSELLWRYEQGQLTEEERGRIERHTRTCRACAKAVRLLADGEDAIAEAEGEADVQRPSAHGPGARRSERRERRGPERSVISERREFRVVLVRERNVRVFVQPLPGFRVAACAVQLPAGAPLTPRLGPDGFEFDLGPEERLAGSSGTVMVKLGETSEAIRCALQL